MALEAVAATRRGREVLDLAGTSPAMQRLRDQIARAAARRGHTLVQAERGFDAATIARAIHDARAPGLPFILFGCADAESAEIERQLFGTSRRRADGGLESLSDACVLRRVRGGTLFLRDVVELPAPVQARLARLLRDGEAHVDEHLYVAPIDARVVSSAATPLDAEVHAGRFREDLARRLSALRLEIPPLRHRPEDIALLAAAAAAAACEQAELPRKPFTPAALTLLGALPWHGNITELERVVERLVRSAPGRTIRLEDVLASVRLDGPGHAPVVPKGTLREARRWFEREYIAAVLHQHRWRTGEAARALGMQRTNLYRKARQLGIVIRSVQ